MNRTLTVALFGSALLAAAGAAPPAWAQPQSGPTQSRVDAPPPSPRVEVRGAAPSPRHVWMGGHWRWTGARHEWTPGRWEIGRPGFVWVEPRWVSEGGGWTFHPGYWGPVGRAAGVEVVVPSEPPRPRVEHAPPPPPGPPMVWIPGNWRWSGVDWAWTPGHYEARRSGFVWERPAWVAAPGGWRFVPGRWRPVR